jgi:hypothetical protein
VSGPGRNLRVLAAADRMLIGLIGDQGDVRV